MQTYKIAGVIFGLKTIYKYTENLCKDYLCTSGQAEFDIVTTEADIAAERALAPEFSDAYLESLAVYRRLCVKMTSDYSGFIFHSSAIAVDGQAYVFTAPSGTGKSTHARLWREMLGERAMMINDDKPIMRFEDDGFYVYGTPWNGKHRLSNNVRVRVKAICELYQSPQNTVKKVTAKEIMPTLLNQTLRPDDAADMMKFLDLIEKLINSVNFYSLGCNISEDAARLSYRTMSEDK